MSYAWFTTAVMIEWRDKPRASARAPLSALPLLYKSFSESAEGEIVRGVMVLS